MKTVCSLTTTRHIHCSESAVDSSGKTDSYSKILVEDNGRGFAPDDDSEPHTALKNIQQRPEIMCNGSVITVNPDNIAI